MLNHKNYRQNGREKLVKCQKVLPNDTNILNICLFYPFPHFFVLQNLSKRRSQPRLRRVYLTSKSFDSGKKEDHKIVHHRQNIKNVF